MEKIAAGVRKAGACTMTDMTENDAVEIKREGAHVGMERHGNGMHVEGACSHTAVA